MDVERTMEFILKSQANAERRMDNAERRADNAERRMDKVDRRLAGISKLLQQGMRMLVKTDTNIAKLARRTDAALAELAAAHKETERSLKAFINSLRNGRNGR